MLVAAAEERIPDQLRGHASAGLDAATAARLAASSFASRTLYDPGTCIWLTGEIAAALGLATSAGYTPTLTADIPPPQQRPGESRPGPATRPGDRDDDHVRAMLETLQAHGPAPSLQLIYDGLRELDYLPHAPTARRPGSQQKRYLRWTDPARGGPAILYLETSSLCFVRTEDLTVLADLPQGTTTLGGRHHNVRFPISPQTTGQILLAARRVKR